MKKDVILIKYGGSVITDKQRPQFINYVAIHSMNSQLVQLLSERDVLFILANGGGSFGHYYAQKYSLGDNIVNDRNLYGICAGRNGNNYLNQLIVDDLIERNVNSCSVRISSIYYPSIDWSEVLLYLEYGIVPVLYGDIILLGKGKYNIISTEHIFLDFCKYINVSEKYNLKKVIMCSNTNGVMDIKGNTIPVWNEEYNLDVHTCKQPRYDVTGGILEKVSKAIDISKYCDVQIVNGNEKNAIIKAYQDMNCGTVFRCLK